MKRLTRRLFSAGLASLTLAFPVLLQAGQVLEVENGYVRGLPPGTQNTAAYMTLRNRGDVDVELVAAASPVAGSVMLHSTVDHGGMLHMEHLHGLVIPAGAEVVLKSGGIHLMLMQLGEMPKPGEEVALTLQFADGSMQELRLPVRSVLDE